MSSRYSLDMTCGPFLKKIMIFSVPLILTGILQLAYNTADVIVVGRFVGTAGLSAVSQSSQIINFATMVLLGFSNAGQVLVSQAFGAGKKKEMNDIIGTMFSVMTIFAAILSVIIIEIKQKVIYFPFNIYVLTYGDQFLQGR